MVHSSLHNGAPAASSSWRKLLGDAANAVQKPARTLAILLLEAWHEDFTLGKNLPQAAYLPPEELVKKKFSGLKRFHEKLITSADKKTQIGLWEKDAQEDQPVYVLFHGRNGHWGYSDDRNKVILRSLTNNHAYHDQTSEIGYDPYYRLRLLEAMAEKGGVVAVHTRGFGLSNEDLQKFKKLGSASKVNLSEMALDQDMDALADYLLKKMPPEKIVVAGESLGGAMAAMFTKKLVERSAPPKVLGLINTFDNMPHAVEPYVNARMGKMHKLMPWEEWHEITVKEIAKHITERFNISKWLRYLKGKPGERSPDVYIAHTLHDDRVSHKKALSNTATAVKAGLNCKLRIWENKDLVQGTRKPHVGWDPHKIADDLEEMYRTGQLSQRVNQDTAADNLAAMEEPDRNPPPLRKNRNGTTNGIVR